MYMESNVWMLFESAVFGKQGVLKGKADAAEQIKSYKRAKNLAELNDGANILFETANALELTKIVPPNSVDYIFTDPPYGGAVQYFELSTLWASWLNLDLDYAEEITINGQQNKDFDYYHKMLRSAFREMYRVLKPNRYLTVTFHSTEIAVWNSIIKAVVLGGFELEKIVYQPPARPSAKGLLQPYGSAVGDYYIRFRKPETEKRRSEQDIDKETYEREVVWAAKEIIEERGEPTIYQRILNSIMVDLQGRPERPGRRPKHRRRSQRPRRQGIRADRRERREGQEGRQDVVAQRPGFHQFFHAVARRPSGKGRPSRPGQEGQGIVRRRVAGGFHPVSQRPDARHRGHRLDVGGIRGQNVRRPLDAQAGVAGGAKGKRPQPDDLSPRRAWKEGRI